MDNARFDTAGQGKCECRYAVGAVGAGGGGGGCTVSFVGCAQRAMSTTIPAIGTKLKHR
jgi:hypothetical protein